MNALTHPENRCGNCFINCKSPSAIDYNRKINMQTGNTEFITKYVYLLVLDFK